MSAPGGQPGTFGWVGWAAKAKMDARLTRGDRAPVLVAVSGGGDSLALLLVAREWALGAGRALVAVTVDHGLQEASADWTLWCSRLCERLEVEHLGLAWTGPKPATGLVAAARGARHRLLARAARGVGARVILMGHTADDRREARLMAAEGASVCEPREWSPSPVWPEGRSLFILRPLIGAARGELRAALADAGQEWIEDPANDDPRSARARARARMTQGAPPVAVGAPRAERNLMAAARVGAHGDIFLRAPALADAPWSDVRILTGASLLCASGISRPPRRRRLDALAERLRRGEALVATLAGARVESDGEVIHVMRDAGLLARSPAARVSLRPGEPAVWDGRFELTAGAPGLTAAPVAGLGARLDAHSRAALKALPRSLRPSLPALLREGRDGGVASLATQAPVRTIALAAQRLAGACGAIRDEAGIGRVAETLASA